MKPPTALVVALVIAGVAFASACTTSPDSADVPRLPDIELEYLDGSGAYRLDQTGAPRVLNLWATWCAPCRAELPVFDRLAAQIDTPEIIGINVGDSGEEASELVDQLGLDFPQLLDPRAAIQRELRTTGMPVTIVVDADGQVAAIHNGELTRPELLELIQEHLGLDVRS